MNLPDCHLTHLQLLGGELGSQHNVACTIWVIVELMNECLMDSESNSPKISTVGSRPLLSTLAAYRKVSLVL